MRFDLFGFDFFPKDKLFGLWFCAVRDYEDIHKSLFSLYYADGEIFFELFYLTIYKN